MKSSVHNNLLERELTTQLNELAELLAELLAQDKDAIRIKNIKHRLNIAFSYLSQPEKKKQYAYLNHFINKTDEALGEILALSPDLINNNKAAIKKAQQVIKSYEKKCLYYSTPRKLINGGRMLLSSVCQGLVLTAAVVGFSLALGPVGCLIAIPLAYTINRFIGAGTQYFANVLSKHIHKIIPQNKEAKDIEDYAKKNAQSLRHILSEKNTKKSLSAKDDIVAAQSAQSLKESIIKRIENRLKLIENKRKERGAILLDKKESDPIGAILSDIDAYLNTLKTQSATTPYQGRLLLKEAVNLDRLVKEITPDLIDLVYGQYNKAKDIKAKLSTFKTKALLDSHKMAKIVGGEATNFSKRASQVAIKQVSVNVIESMLKKFASIIAHGFTSILSANIVSISCGIVLSNEIEKKVQDGVDNLITKPIFDNSESKTSNTRVRDMQFSSFFHQVKNVEKAAAKAASQQTLVCNEVDKVEADLPYGRLLPA